jgi:F-type H+-transporting ATPase subunit delta
LVGSFFALFPPLSLTYPKTLVSSGFATVHPNNRLIIHAVGAAPLDDFSVEVCSSVIKNPNTLNLNDLFMKAVHSNLQEALKVAGRNGSEAEKMEAHVEADIYESIQNALAK